MSIPEARERCGGAVAWFNSTRLDLDTHRPREAKELRAQGRKPGLDGRCHQ